MMRALSGSPLRFTVEGTREFDRWMGSQLLKIAEDVRSALGENLVALTLGGGYGRGEGGVVKRGDVEAPYNDLDLVVIVHRKIGVASRLEPVADKHARLLGIAVDFSRPLTVTDVSRWEHRLRWHDLLHAHIVLAGDPRILDRHAPVQLTRPVPIAEASRLLLNRGAGLLWSSRIAAGLDPAPDEDFVRRNAFKALLAIGDAYLIAAGVVAPRHAGRLELLRARRATLPHAHAGEILDRYRDAIQFKFAPGEHGPGTDLLAAAVELWPVAFLDIERRRFGRTWPSLAEYARWPGVREPQPPGSWWWNVIRNLRLLSLSHRSPREPLYRELPALLGQRGAAWDRDSGRLLRVWHRVND